MEIVSTALSYTPIIGALIGGYGGFFGTISVGDKVLNDTIGNKLKYGCVMAVGGGIGLPIATVTSPLWGSYFVYKRVKHGEFVSNNYKISIFGKEIVKKRENPPS